MEDDFPRIELVQLQVVLGRPRCNVVEFCGARVGALSRDDEVAYVSSANLTRLLLAWCGLRSAAVTAYDAGPRLEP